MPFGHLTLGFEIIALILMLLLELLSNDELCSASGTLEDSLSSLKECAPLVRKEGLVYCSG